MDIELFKKNYTPLMMSLVNTLAKKLEYEIKHDISTGNHHIIMKAKYKIETLAECKMLLEVYEGCPICFKLDCQSDHK